MIFCLLVPAVWTSLAGRFSSHEADTIFFLQDHTNLILYAFVCPAYVGLGCWLAVSAITGWSDIRSAQRSLNVTPSAAPSASFVKSILLVVLVLAMGMFSTANYIKDIFNKSNVKQLYWFMDVTSSGEHVLGALGVYYFLLNFILLMVTLVSIVLFMSVFVATFAVGDALRDRKDSGDLDFDALRSKLSVFTETYILAKLLTFTYIINFYLWKGSPLGATQNIYSAYVFLTLFGVLFVSFPRYYVELQWFRLRVRAGEVQPGDDVYEDIRTLRARDVAAFADVLIIGGFSIAMFKALLLS